MSFFGRFAMLLTFLSLLVLCALTTLLHGRGRLYCIRGSLGVTMLVLILMRYMGQI
jgi:hypothetical protein